MPSWTRTGAGPCWNRSIAQTCSSSRWTTAAAGIAITISSGTCCERTSPTSSPTSSRSSSTGPACWFEQDGDAPEAIRHALAAADYPRAADLIERAGPSLRSTRQEALLLAWLKALPDDVHRRAARAERRLRRCAARARAARGGRGAPPGRGTVAGRVRRWVGANDGRAGRADRRRAPRTSGGCRARSPPIGPPRRWPSATWPARSARRRSGLELAAPDDPLARGSAAGLLALAYWSNGDLEAAHRSWTECATNLEKAGHIADLTGPAMAMADIRVTQGRLRDAHEHLRASPAVPGRTGSARASWRGRHARRHERAPDRAR